MKEGERSFLRATDPSTAGRLTPQEPGVPAIWPLLPPESMCFPNRFYEPEVFIMKVICACCRFFSAIDDRYQKGQCRRRTPVPRLVFDGRHDGSGIGVWPIISSESWCGEFEHRFDALREQQDTVEATEQAINRQVSHTSHDVCARCEEKEYRNQHATLRSNATRGHTVADVAGAKVADK